MRIEIKVALHDTQLDRLHIMWTLRQDDAVGTIACRSWLSQASEGEKLIIMQLTLGIDEQDIEGGLHVAVLEAIIEEDHLGALFLRECE